MRRVLLTCVNCQYQWLARWYPRSSSSVGEHRPDWCKLCGNAGEPHD